MRPQFLIGVVASVVAVGAARAHVPACESAQAELGALETSLTVYAIKHDGRLPPRAGWFDALVQAGLADESARLDPWGHPYVYWPKTGDDFELMTVGRDGKTGSKDDQVRAKDWAWTACGDPSSLDGCGC